MICKIIREFGLFIFWNCLDNERREKAIKKHNYLNIKTEEIDSLVKTRDDYKYKYFYLKDELINFKIKIDSMNDINHIKRELSYFVNLVEKNV